MRLVLLEAVLALEGTSQVPDVRVTPITAARLLDLMDSSELTGEARVRWLLRQRLDVEESPVEAWLEQLERDLGVRIVRRRAISADAKLISGHRTVSAWLDEAARAAGLHWRVRDGAIELGRLEDLVR